MRIYEYAKKVKITSKELLKELSSNGFKFKSHMSVLTDKAEDFLNRQFKQGLVKSDINDAGVKEKKGGSVTGDEPKNDKSALEKKSVIENETKINGAGITNKIEKSNKSICFDSVKKNVVDMPVSTRRPHKKVITKIEIQKEMPLLEVAKLMGRHIGDLIFVLLKKGIVCNINSVVSIDTIRMIAQEFHISVHVGDAIQENALLEKKFERTRSGDTRWPIVVVMGHVDHGKTTLLDYLRKMNVAGKEKGGITQHIGAYEVDSSHGKMVFLDTPGHEAFSYMREKGAKVTDIAILVIAADDGVKPQTIEAIEHAKSSDVPIIVAINKIDKPGAESGIEAIKRQLAQHDLVTEDWGGQTICVPISAKTGQGIEELLEMITLQSEIMELKADSNLPARAFVLESKMEKGHGPVATVITVDGTLKRGDFFICGGGTGKVRLLINSFGEKILLAEPSIPVKVVGFDDFASIGEWLQVVDRKEYLKAKASGVSSIKNRDKNIIDLSAVSDFRMDMQQGESLNLIVKTDTNGSREAVSGSIAKLSKQKKDIHSQIKIVSIGIGDVSEGDVLLAESTNALILGLHVKAEKNAILLAKEKNVEIKLYDVIYHVIEDIEKILLSKKVDEVRWKKIGKLNVLKVFHLKKTGTIAGCSVSSGIITRNSKVECIRNGQKIGEGMIVSLQRERKSVKEVHAGYECGFATDKFHDWNVGDEVIVYSNVKEKEGVS